MEERSTLLYDSYRIPVNKLFHNGGVQSFFGKGQSDTERQSRGQGKFELRVLLGRTGVVGIGASSTM